MCIENKQQKPLRNDRCFHFCFLTYIKRKLIVVTIEFRTNHIRQ